MWKNCRSAALVGLVAPLTTLGCASRSLPVVAPLSSGVWAAQCSGANSSNGESATAAPSEPRAAPSTLAQAIERAVEQNAGLHAAFERWQSAEARAEGSGALPDPKFSYSEFLEEVQTRTGPQERRFGISQSFPWPGKLRAQSDADGHRADARQLDYAAQRLALVERVAQAYYDLAFLATHTRIQRESRELLRQVEPIVQRRIQAGGPQEDLLRLQMEIGRAENDLLGLERARPAHEARLAALWNESDPRIPALELREPTLGTTRSEEWLARALAGNPSLASLRASIEEARERQSQATLARRPDFTLGVDYFQTGSAVDPSTPGSGDDPIALQLSLNLPIWSTRNDAREREQENQVRALLHELEDREARIAADIEYELYLLDDAARQLMLQRDSLLPRAREALELTLASYRSGGASLLDWLDAERALLEYERSYWRACRDYHVRMARLQTLAGEAPQ